MNVIIVTGLEALPVDTLCSTLESTVFLTFVDDKLTYTFDEFNDELCYIDEGVKMLSPTVVQYDKRNNVLPTSTGHKQRIPTYLEYDDY